MTGNVDFIKLFSGALATFAAVGAAFAFDHADETSLEAALQRYAADLEAERFGDIAALRPRAIALSSIARPDKLNIIDVSFDTSRARVQTSPGGLDFAFVPTLTVISERIGVDTEVHSQTFVLQEDGIWRFFDLPTKDSFEFVQTAYPDFASIEPPDLKGPE